MPDEMTHSEAKGWIDFAVHSPYFGMRSRYKLVTERKLIVNYILYFCVTF